MKKKKLSWNSEIWIWYVIAHQKKNEHVKVGDELIYIFIWSGYHLEIYMLIYISCRLMLLPIFRMAFFSTGWWTDKMQSTLKHMWKYFKEYTLIKYIYIFCVAYRLLFKCQRLFLGVSLAVRKIPKKKNYILQLRSISYLRCFFAQLKHFSNIHNKFPHTISTTNFIHEFSSQISTANFPNEFFLDKIFPRYNSRWIHSHLS